MQEELPLKKKDAITVPAPPPPQPKPQTAFWDFLDMGQAVVGGGGGRWGAGMLAACVSNGLRQQAGRHVAHSLTLGLFQVELSHIGPRKAAAITRVDQTVVHQSWFSAQTALGSGKAQAKMRTNTAKSMFPICHKATQVKQASRCAHEFQEEKKKQLVPSREESRRNRVYCSVVFPKSSPSRRLKCLQKAESHGGIPSLGGALRALRASGCS